MPQVDSLFSVSSSKEARVLLRLAAFGPHGVRIGRLAEVCPFAGYQTVKNALRNGMERGDVERISYGWYRRTPPTVETEDGND